jgi:hypothetical protein
MVAAPITRKSNLKKKENGSKGLVLNKKRVGADGFFNDLISFRSLEVTDYRT